MYKSDIDISSFKIVNKSILDEIETEFFKQFEKIPEEFNWAYNLPNDTKEVRRKKALISKVKNQHLCGCCWAISSATAISDVFVVSNIVTWSPNISYTYAMAKYPQHKCMGGSGRLLLEQIKNGDGITSDFCVDDKWCSTNSKCLQGNAMDHFSSGNKEYLSSLIPAVGCYNPNVKHFVYRINDVYSMTSPNKFKVLDTQIKMKQHIMVRGPLIGGFIIYEDFINGKFVSNNQGIYLEPPVESAPKILGSHSVVIVGWGLSKNVNFNGILTDIPYWFCRNSWGTEWGDNGYFKIAMYPYNKISQFSKKIRVVHNGLIKEIGGVTGIKVTDYPELKYLPSNNAVHLLKKSRNKFILSNQESDKINTDFIILAAIVSVLYFSIIL